MAILTYKSKADLEKALRILAARDGVLKTAYQKYGVPPMRRSKTGFQGLARLLISQQVSTAAARAIQARFDETLKDVTPQNFLLQSDAKIAKCGISTPKRRYLRALAQTILAGDLKFTSLHRQEDAIVHAQLTALIGIGAWTADCYLLFCLQRTNVFPSGDLALQAGYQMLYAKRTRPDAAQLMRYAQVWHPHRGAAARLLWLYYNGEKTAEKQMRAQAKMK